MSKIKIGIIGAGSISQCHIHGYKQLNNVEIIAVCDINRERAEKTALQHGIPHVYTDYNEMLKDVKLDGVSVCTWNNVHAPISIAALNAGVNVICEKPLAMNAKEAMEMVIAARQNNKLLMVGFVRRFARKVEYVKSLIDENRMGDIYYVKAGCIRRCGNPGGWFSNKELSGGGPMIDLGVHMIDMIYYLMGKPGAVSVTGVAFDKIGSRPDVKGIGWYKSADYSSFHDVEDAASAFIRFSNGAAAFVETSWTENVKSDKLYLDMYGSKLGVMIEPDLILTGEKNNYLFDESPVIADDPNEFMDCFDREMEHFVDCIANDTPCLNPGEDGLQIMKILDAIYESAEKGCEIEVEA